MHIAPGQVEHYARCGDTPAKVSAALGPVREEFKA